ncbi:MAG: protease [Sulfurovum sp. FS08-3]|nr:MAG: protease [Sulfurovum sp. FS08-3]
MEQLKTLFLLVFMSVVFVFVGFALAGSGGAMMALLLAGGMNFYAYYFSDKQVLSHYDAQLIEATHPIYDKVARLTQKANLPMPKVYIINDGVPNAFATGRNPNNAAIAVTNGLLKVLNPDEIEAVLAHELSHVKHYDILVGTVAASIAGAIAWVASMVQFGNSNRNSNPIVMILLMLLLPIAATIIQLSISRSREYMADEGAAKLVGDPSHLQNALLRIENYAQNYALHNAKPQDAHMFIINPLKGVDFKSLFSTHPSTDERIRRLEALKYKM